MKNTSPVTFYKALADETRLKTLLLILLEKELCVCELMVALDEESQPKISRHLAQLRNVNLLSTRKERQWVFYSINKDLDDWMQQVLLTTLNNNAVFVKTEQKRLALMGDRPTRIETCCA